MVFWIVVALQLAVRSCSCCCLCTVSQDVAVVAMTCCQISFCVSGSVLMSAYKSCHVKVRKAQQTDAKEAMVGAKAAFDFEKNESEQRQTLLASPMPLQPWKSDWVEVQMC